VVEPVKASAEKGQPWLMAKVLRRDPLVTITSAGSSEFHVLELAAVLPELFDVPRGLHLLHFTHTIESWHGPDDIAAAHERAKAALPGHEFLMLTASETEGWLLAQHGVPSLLGIGLMFANERIWKPSPALIPGLRVYDAIYSARLAPNKRHELASAIKSLMLVYGHSLAQSENDAYQRVQALLPQAFFANHEAGQGSYIKFGAADMVKLLGHAQVGLCLSKVEGCMRSSIEYGLAGLSIVSTRSIGGRDRYLIGPHCRIVPDDPDRIAAAVGELCDAALDRRRVRSYVAQMLAFDRYNFLLQINKIAERLLGQQDLFPTIEPFIDSVSRFRPLREIVAMLRADIDGGSGTQASNEAAG